MAKTRPVARKAVAKREVIGVHEPYVEQAVLGFEDKLLAGIGVPAPSLVAFAARSVLRVWGLMNKVGEERGPDPLFDELLSLNRVAMKAAYDFCAGTPREALEADVNRLVRSYSRLAAIFVETEANLQPAAWSAGTAAARLKDCFTYTKPDALARNAFAAVAYAFDAVWRYYRPARVWHEIASLYAATQADAQFLVTSQIAETFDVFECGPLGHLWPVGRGAAPDWYRQVQVFTERLTRPGECWNVLDMPSKDPQPRRKVPAIQQVLEAFDAASLPRPPISKVSGLDTPGAFKLLGAFEKYLDRVGDPVVNGVRTLLAELRDRSFASIEDTRAFVDRVQSILDRAGYAVVCPSCSEQGRLDVATSKHLPAGGIRVKHGRESTHGGGGLITSYEFAPKP